MPALPQPTFRSDVAVMLGDAIVEEIYGRDLADAASALSYAMRWCALGYELERDHKKAAGFLHRIREDIDASLAALTRHYPEG